MKKQTVFVVVLLVVVILILVGVGVNLRSKKHANVDSKISTVSDIKTMFNSIYSNLEDELPSLETAEIDVSDEMSVETYTGLKSNENVEALVVSEPMMSSQAYSAVAVKVKNGANVEEMKQEMLDNINTSKWICVTAGKVYVTNCGNTIFLVMADEDWAKPVYNEFVKYVNNKIGKELEKTAEEDIMLPDERFVVQ